VTDDVIEGTVEDDEQDVRLTAQDAATEGPDPELAGPVPAVPDPAAVPVAPRRTAGELVTSQAAAVAATGFAVGAVTAVALSRRHTRRAAKKGTNGRSRREVAKHVVASRSFLVDVHLLAPKD